MNEVEVIHDQLHRAFRGGSWHGPSLKAALRGITDQQACATPPGGVHRIWELALHLTAWNSAVLRRLRGEPVRMRKIDDWPPVQDTSPAAWKQTLRALDDSHEALLAEVATMKPRDLDRPAGGSAPGTARENLLGTVQHYSYHGGQISLLKRILQQH